MCRKLRPSRLACRCGASFCKISWKGVQKSTSGTRGAPRSPSFFVIFEVKKKRGRKTDLRRGPWGVHASAAGHAASAAGPASPPHWPSSPVHISDKSEHGAYAKHSFPYPLKKTPHYKLRLFISKLINCALSSRIGGLEPTPYWLSLALRAAARIYPLARTGRGPSADVFWCAGRSGGASQDNCRTKARQMLDNLSIYLFIYLFIYLSIDFLWIFSDFHRFVWIFPDFEEFQGFQEHLGQPLGTSCGAPGRLLGSSGMTFGGP